MSFTIELPDNVFWYIKNAHWYCWLYSYLLLVWFIFGGIYSRKKYAKWQKETAEDYRYSSHNNGRKDEERDNLVGACAIWFISPVLLPLIGILRLVCFLAVGKFRV